MKKYHGVVCFIIACIAFPVVGVSQALMSIDTIPRFRHIDTIAVYSENCKVEHYRERSYEKGQQMLSMHDSDIFNGAINDFSKLVILQVGYDPVEVSTIPMDNIVLLDSPKLVIGLTKVKTAPYKIVIYKYNGELVYKGNLGVDMIKINHKKLKEITQKFPELVRAFKESGNVIKQDGFYYVELSNDVRHILGSGFYTKYFSEEWLYIGSYLPFHIALSSSSPYHYRRLEGGYLGASPYNDLIIVNRLPFVLVLNNVEGSKSYIPLVSNCDIEKDLR